MNRVAVYLRVSTEEQAQEGFSIEGQLKSAQEYCEKYRYSITAVYKDEGISAKDIEKRGDMKRMLNDCNGDSFDYILVWKVNRLARNQKDFLNMLDHFEKCEKQILSISEQNVDLSTPMGKMIMQMLGSVAEFERNIIVDNVKMGMKTRAQNGLWNGGIMLGYKSESKRLVILENEAFIVKRIFDLYIGGKGYKAIANLLNHEGYKSKKGGAFSINSIRQIITNPAYAGFIRFNKQQNWSEKRRSGTNPCPHIARGVHEPIINMETWVKANSTFQTRSHKPTKTFTGHFPLTTLLRCPTCGQGMIGQRTKRSKASNEYIRYYICGNFHYKGSAVCRSNSIRADYAEQYVFGKLKEVATTRSLLRSIVQNVNSKIKNVKAPIQRQYDMTLKGIEKVNFNASRYMSLFDNNEMDNVFVVEKLNRLQSELKTLELRKAEIEQRLAQPTIKEVSLSHIYGVLCNFSKLMEVTPPEQQKAILHRIIAEITLNPSDNIKGRSIKDIKLVFDASENTDYVLTCGMVPPALS